jgi:hypothetical protein
MYGLVNQGVESFVKQTFGPAEWADLCARAGLAGQHFETMISYPDDVTYRLVTAICEKHGMPAAEVLEGFGDFWVDFASETHVGRIIDFGGPSLFDRLAALDEMHERIRMGMPHLRPPEFEFEDLGGGTARLHYASRREGLEAMVIGLVKGLARDTGERIEITQDPQPAYEDLRATFTIRRLG